MNFVKALVELEIKRVVKGNKKWLLIIYNIVPLILCVYVVYLTNRLPFVITRHDLREFIVAYFLLYHMVICLWLSFHLGSFLISEEINDKTIVYLSTKPVHIYLICLVKYLTQCGMIILFSITSFSISYFLVVSSSLVSAKDFVGLLVAIVISSFSYMSIFFLLGALFPQSSTIIGIIYIIVVEYLGNLVSGVINKMCVSYYTLMFLSKAMNITLQERIFVPSQDAQNNIFFPIGVLTVITLVALCSGLWLESKKEYRITEEV